MKWLIVILLAFVSSSFIGENNVYVPTVLMRDTVPTGAAPQLFGSKLYEFKNYTLTDSFIMVMAGDTFAIPRWPAIKYKSSDNRWYGYHGQRWRAFLNGTDTVSLSNRIDNAGITLSNVGNAYRLVATPLGSIKTVAGSNTILLDSSSNSNAITIKADTSVLATQYDITQVGNENIQQTLNIGDTARRHIIYKYDADTTDDAYIWQIIPSNYGADYGPEGVQGGYSAGWHRGNGVNASGRPNVVLNFAQYNTSNGGGRVNPGDAAARFALETHFNTGGQRLFEIHVPELTLYNGTQKRPFSMYMNKETGATQFNYFSTAGVDYQSPTGQGLLSFGGLGGLQVFGRTGNLSLLLQADDGNTYRELMLEGGGIQHLSYGGDQYFDSRTIFNNTFNTLPSVIVTDHRSASTIGLQIHIDGTSAAKTPIQIDANTIGGIETQFLNGTGTAKHLVTGIGNDCSFAVRNLNPNDPSGGNYNAGYYFFESGNGAASGSIGAYFGNSNLGDIDESEVVINTSNIPLAFTVNAIEKTRMTSSGKWLINRKAAIGTEHLSVNGTINALADSLNMPSNMLWMDNDGHIKKAAVAADGNGIYGGSGSLPGNVTVTGAGNTLTLTGTQASAAAFNVSNTGNGEAISGVTTGTGSALSVANSGSGTGATLSSNTGTAVNATSTSGTLFRGIVNPSSTNTEVVTLRTIRQSSGTPAAGMGQIYSMDLEDNNLNNISAVQQKAVWTSPTAGATSADYQLWSVNAGTLAQRFTIKSTGQLQLNNYGTGSFTAGTPAYALKTTSAGLIIEAQELDGTTTLDFGSTAPGAATDLTMTVTGAAVGDLVVLGIPNGAVPANGTYVAWVSATNTVTVRYINTDPSITYDPASGSFKARILK